MTSTVQNYRWSQGEFVRAFEAGVFDRRVELVDGEVWPVVIGDWHGRTVATIIGQVGSAGGVVSTSTLPSGNSLPDPDCWVLRRGAAPAGAVGAKLSRWAGADVLLVVEVSDETIMADLTVKAALYGTAGYEHYWVVTPEVVFVHSEPHDEGYRVRTEYRAGDQLPVPYADTHLDVSLLLTSA